MVAKLASVGIACILRADYRFRRRGVSNGVETATLSSGAETLACDTICVAIGLIPSIELVDAMHGPRALSAELRGLYSCG
jgi:hypothetical protein